MKRAAFERLFEIIGFEILQLFQQHLEVYDDRAVFGDQNGVAVNGFDFGDFQNQFLNFLQRFRQRSDRFGFFAADAVQNRADFGFFDHRVKVVRGQNAHRGVAHDFRIDAARAENHHATEVFVGIHADNRFGGFDNHFLNQNAGVLQLEFGNRRGQFVKRGVELRFVVNVQVNALHFRFMQSVQIGRASCRERV